jgi:hypothetical protein
MGHSRTTAVMLMLSAAVVGCVGQYPTWVEPAGEEEVHFKPSRFHRYPTVGLTADEKAGNGVHRRRTTYVA